MSCIVFKVSQPGVDWLCELNSVTAGGQQPGKGVWGGFHPQAQIIRYSTLDTLSHMLLSHLLTPSLVSVVSRRFVNVSLCNLTNLTARRKKLWLPFNRVWLFTTASLRTMLRKLVAFAFSVTIHSTTTFFSYLSTFPPLTCSVVYLCGWSQVDMHGQHPWDDSNLDPWCPHLGSNRGSCNELLHEEEAARRRKPATHKNLMTGEKLYRRNTTLP